MKVFPASSNNIWIQETCNDQYGTKLIATKSRNTKTKIHSVFTQGKKRANRQQRDFDWSENQVKQSLSKVAGGRVQYSSSFKIKKISSWYLQ